jgi:hypothetical protein
MLFGFLELELGLLVARVQNDARSLALQERT